MTEETTDSWPLGKILKCIFLSKPKGSPKAGKKEISLRLCVGGLFGILSFLLWSATHTIRLPSCDKTETLSTIEKIVNGLPDAVAKNIKYVSLGNIAEQGYNEQQELRTCTGRLVTTDGEINVHYTLRWQDKQAGQFYAEIKTTQQPAAEPISSASPQQQPIPEPTQPEENQEDIAAFVKTLSLQQAIDLAKPNMADIQGLDVSKGTAMLAFWSTINLKWNELQDIPKGKYGLTMKDSESQRGKRLCVSGEIIEIERDKSVAQPIFSGGIYDEGGRIYRFIAVGSTGEIVANSNAVFCGIVTGQQHYPNSMGGMSHAVTLVGMFDLPENKPTESSKKTM